MLLSCLESGEKNGYELLVDLDALFGDQYEPSSGSVYPALTALVDAGLIIGRPAGRSTTYVMTSAGRRLLRAKSDVISRIEKRTSCRVRADSSLDATIARFATEVRSLEPPPRLLDTALNRTLHSLRRSMMKEA